MSTALRGLYRSHSSPTRLPGAVLAADIVGSFERDLEANVLIAFFLPGIVYMADAVGTQTEALIIRGLSVGVPIHRVARRELVTGLLVGAVLSAVLLPVVLLRWGEGDLALAVALGLFGAPPSGYSLHIEPLAPTEAQARYVQRFHVLSEAAGFATGAIAFETE